MMWCDNAVESTIETIKDLHSFRKCFFFTFNHGSSILIQIMYWRAYILNLGSFRAVNHKIYEHFKSVTYA